MAATARSFDAPVPAPATEKETLRLLAQLAPKVSATVRAERLKQRIESDPLLLDALAR